MTGLKFKPRIIIACLVLFALAAGAQDNHAPVLQLSDEYSGKETIGVVYGEKLSFYLKAEDPEGDSIFYLGANLPVNSFLNPNTGFFSWTPTVEQIGDFLITFTAEDNKVPTLSHSVKITVKVGSRMVGMSASSAGGSIKIVGFPLAFPSPYNLSSGQNVTLQYILSQDAEIEIIIFDTTARIVKRVLCGKGNTGGKSGINKVLWNGITEMGGPVANGMHIATIVSKADNTVLGKIKIMVYN
ncbi:hypothetical protein A3H38_06100 [candidate division WOR-1 bacterium RIFCSPLOWO2_02_FULL_46_20]|uniref:FlgD Ig-like domain-containing protein n=2 Tax=Saganbacteria TaxID=1703751 RepID=A0A1F4RBI0_UNCSA|nr:MAG: hypothetical protein A3J44_00610 [candidate division WOR-1 bacterium RIFCSPHIGHO2_02_FULL_45_12]OGC05534.1 MAG: hypothetical protein A3H38_06100 [candidate division WOR-1 bacterium RIFCSPLOWO2_02_FULL_46_20]OGC09182.1 MAG: hypothetical protein A3F86_05510 [candidate division WOR-1 bacterium RIFCSPLOWO2_12_FULL_45_9]